MNKVFKKLTAWLCCMALVISFIPATALPVFADEAEAPEIEQIAVTLTQGELPALEANQEYVLSEDLTLEGDLTIHNVIYVNSEVTFDLAGNSIIAGDGANGGIFALTSDEADLTITDSAEGGKLVSSESTGTPALNIQKGTATLEAGEITGWTRSGAGGMVFVAAGTFNMAGGKLTGASANYGGAIRAENADAVINMTGGEISGNTATDRAPIWLTNGATFNMDGGAIKNNVAATYAGAICVGAGCEFTMTDGVISGNTATTKEGGAIRVDGTATISGGEISGNTSATQGGGIYVSKNASLTIGGDVEITDNAATNVGGGIFLADSTTFVMDGGYVSGNSSARGGGISTNEAAPAAVMTINDGTIEGNTATNRGANLYTYDTALTINGGTIGAAIYGTAAAAANFQNVQARGGNVVITGGNLAAFDMASNNGTKGWGTLAISGNPVIAALYVKADTAPTIGNLSNGASVTLVKGSAELTMQDSYIAVDGLTYTYSVPQLPASGTVAPGEYVLADDHVLTNTLTIAAGTEVTIDLAGNTISMPDKDGQYFTVNGKLTIKDSVGGGVVQFKTTTAGSPAIGIGNSSTEAVFVLEGGELNGWQRAGAGGAIYMYEGATFVMTGGLITDCDATGSSVIRSAGGGQTLTITGGTITGNDTGTNIIGLTTATGANPATVTIGGTANISGNTLNGAAYTAAAYELQFKNAHITVGDEATIGYIYDDGDVETEGVDGYPYSSMTFTGAPTVAGIRWSAGARTSTTVKELTEGAYIKTANGAAVSKTDETVAVEAYDNSATSGVSQDKGNIYTYQVPTYAVTVEQVAGGTIEVDVTEGAAGTKVAVDAIPDEGFELEAILVNGEAIEGNTFDIVAGDNVVTAIFVAADAPLPTSGAVAEGEYVLAADVALENTLSFAGDTVIDLNGHTITMNKANTVFFNVGATGKLTIKDSVGGGKVQFNTTTGSGVYVYGEFVLESGTLTGYFRDGSGALFTVYAGGDFTMTGGSITGNGANAYGLMRAEGGDHTVTITGGEITGNWNKSGYALIQIGKAGVALSTLTIGGDAVLAGNAYGGATFAESALWTATSVVEITTINTHVVIEDEAVVGYIRADGDTPAEGQPVNSSFTITGAPTVAGMTWSSSAKTYTEVVELTEGAEVKTYSKSGGGVNHIDASVIDTTYDNTATGGTEYDKGHVYTWRDPATEYAINVVACENGTVTVDPTVGVYGATVTVTAIAAEGYELETILVDGKAITGNTFTISGNHTVSATFVEAAIATYDVVVIEPLGGSVSVDKNNAAEGETITVTATASEGYELKAIKVNGEAIEGNTFVMPAASVQVTAEFAEIVPEGFPTSGNITAGEYVLTENVQLNGTLSVKGEVVIDLAGYSIFAKQGEGEAYSSGIFDLNEAGCSLTINDSVGGGKLVACDTNGGSSPAVFVQKGVFTLNAGEITGWIREGGAGGMVYVLSGATFTMNGGKLTGAKSSGDGAIRAASGSTITIAGGEISDNTATGSSIINLVDGVNFTMTGGAIKNNTGGLGGALRIASGNFTIAGGEISGNTVAKTGGGIYVATGASLTLAGVAVEDNACTDFSSTSSSFGGGVYLEDGASLTVNDGTVISGNSAVRGGGISVKEPAANAVITINGGTIEGNHASNRAANLYGYDSTVTINGGTIGGALYGADKASAAAAAANFQNVQFRGGKITVTGGNISTIDLAGNTGATYGDLTITGNPVIAALLVKVGQTTTSIGALTTGAVINTTDADALTIAENDETVAHTAGTKLYQFAGDLGLADMFVPGATVTLTENSSVGGGIALTEAGEYTLDLAGFELTGIATPYFTVGAGIKLTITDSSAEQTGKIVGLANAANATIVVDGEFVLAGGTLTGAGNSAVKLNKNAVMTMTGGEISGNSAARGGGVTSGDVTGSNVTFAMTGGTIANNICTQRGANLYFFDPAQVTIAGGTIGAAYLADAEGALTLTTSTVNNAEIRGGKATISGGTIEQIFMSKSSVGVVGTVTGNPEVALMDVQADANVTVGALTTGARIAVTSNYALKGTEAEGAYDATVNAQARLYRFAGDVKTILFVANSFGGDSTKYLTQLGSYFGIELDAAYMYIGSQNVRWHAQSLAESLRNTDLNGDGVIGDSRDKTGSEGLYGVGNEKNLTFPDVLDNGKKWDYVVLQPGVQYVGFEGTYNSDMDFLLDYIAEKQPEATVLWSQTWAMDERSWSNQVNPDKPEQVEAGGYWRDFSDYLTQFGGTQEAMYDAILRNTDKFIVGDDARFADDFDGYLPIGIAIQTMRQNYTDSYLTRDGFHLSHNAGRLIAGLTVMKTLFPEIELSDLTAEQVAAMFAANTENTNAAAHLQDAFEPTEANVATLLAAVETACGYKTTVPAYGEGTANKQFNPDAAVVGANEFVAVYENVTEIGQAVTSDMYATTGAGKIVIYKNGAAVAAIDELWLEANADIVLTDRYEKVKAGEEYFIQADAQAPQLAVVNNTLYMTFDVKLYSDTQNTIYNGGIYLTSSTDGVNWTKAVKISEAPMASGLTALADNSLILSVADTATKVLKVSTAGVVTDTIELDATIADVAFAEFDSKIFALTSNGALYVSADNGLNWTNVGINAGACASPELVSLGTKGIYVTWADETGRDIYYKIWTVDAEDATYGWNNAEAYLLAEDYALATAYNNKTTGGQPASVRITDGLNNTHERVIRTYYVSGGKLQSVERGLAFANTSNLALESSLTMNMKLMKAYADKYGAASAKIIRTYGDGKAPVTTEINIAEGLAEGTVKVEGTGSNVTYTFPYNGIAAKEMGDKVLLILLDAEGKQISLVNTFSAEAYAYGQLKSSKIVNATTGTDNYYLRPVLVDMLNYGAAAQLYFGYDVENLVNADLTEAQKAWGSGLVAIDDSLKEGVVAATVAKTNANVTTATVVELNVKYGITGTLATQIQNAAYATVDYITHANTPVHEQIALVQDGTAMVAKINSLATADLRTVITIRLHNADGSVIEGTERTNNITAYIHGQLKNGYDETNDLHVVLMNLLKYGDSAFMYKHWKEM